MNAQAQMLERGMVKAGIPYRIIGGVRFYERKEIKDIVAYLSLIHNPADTLRLRRIINEPKRKIGDGTVNMVLELAAESGKSAFEVVDHADTYEPLARRASDLMQFGQMIHRLMELADTCPLGELLDTLLEDTGYLRMLQAEGFEGQTRLENIEELKSTMNRYEEENTEPTLAGFLEEISLYTDIDKFDPTADNVVLMTMHSAKGLEFDHVFVAGIEEGIFPGVQSMFDPAQIEEERRLAYVSLTRAKKRLYLSTAAQRMLFGQTMRNRPSRFLAEVPGELTQLTDAVLQRQAAAPQKQPTVRRQRVNPTDKLIGIGGGMPRSQQENQPEISYRTGDRVSHKVFGEGTDRKSVV